MSFALGAIILIILLLPPLVLYQSMIFGKENNIAPYLRKLNLTEKLLGTALFALIIHALAIAAIGCFTVIRFDLIIALLGLDKWRSAPGTGNPYCSNRDLQYCIEAFAVYNTVLNLIAGAIGYLIGKRLEHKLDFLNSKWYFVFTGRIKEGTPLKAGIDFDVVSIDAVVNTGAGTMIYSGYLVDFTCDDEDLDRIYLSSVFRRDFRKTIKEGTERYAINEPGEYLAVPSDVFIIKYEHIINMNVCFMKISQDLTEVQALPLNG
jgi:hypothetical protein